MRAQPTRSRHEDLPLREDDAPPITRQAVVALYAGLALTVLAMLALGYDLAAVGGLDRHLREVYEGYVAPPDAGGIATYLFILGALGVAGWLWTTWAVHRRKRSARPVATALFALGSLVALAHLTVTEYGQTILPTAVGVASLLPCLAGLVAVVLLWRPPG